MMLKNIHRSNSRWIILLIGLFFYSSTQGEIQITSNVPDIGQRTQLILSAETERILGQGIMRKIRGSDEVITDLIVNDYLEILRKKLEAAAPGLDFKLHVFALNSPEPNAFAFFGGHIAVHRGLIQLLDNENELVAVLAHETAHIAQRHLARIVTNHKKLMPLTFVELMGAFAMSILGGVPEAGNPLAIAVLAGHTQQLINFTREHEQEADRMGMYILKKAGFNPRALPTVFQTLNSKTRYQERPPEYLLTHPLFESRIADCMNRLEKTADHPTPSSLFFHLVRARLEVMAAHRIKQHLQRMRNQQASDQAHNRIAARYAYALALAKNRQYAEASSILEALPHPNTRAENWIFILSLAETEADAGNSAAALSRLKPLILEYPNRYPIILKYAEILLQTQQSQLAEQILTTRIPEYRTNPEVLQLLVRAYSMLNRPVILHETQAEWHFVRGEFKEAFQQLDIAKEHASQDALALRKIKSREARMHKTIDAQERIRTP